MSKQLRSGARRRVKGTDTRPRLSVSLSNRQVTAQVIDDVTGKTLAFSTSYVSDEKGTMTDKAKWVGSDIAKKAKKAKIKQVVFDRGPKKYHGRVAALAEAARKEGLEF